MLQKPVFLLLLSSSLQFFLSHLMVSIRKQSIFKSNTLASSSRLQTTKIRGQDTKMSCCTLCSYFWQEHYYRNRVTTESLNYPISICYQDSVVYIHMHMHALIHAHAILPTHTHTPHCSCVSTGQLQVLSMLRAQKRMDSCISSRGSAKWWIQDTFIRFLCQLIAETLREQST